MIVIGHRQAGDAACGDVGARRTTTVDLAQPLGERAVLEVRQGMPVALTVTG
ncbi:hypothetical protein [Micromonospora sp. ATA51]|uniref:hypothetical protein n=1 Tax=Micromonospora sp. ATA51 TaxID=2806098 RepID=UPI001A626D7F|nr:hypothetical protein [Micromonospora sp. ATA51]MBM0224823.1 hypothetical protein [Micromonospora sp. ATA51]